MKPPSKYAALKATYSEILEGFKTSLAKQHYQPGTIRQFTNYTAYFFNWKEKQGIDLAEYSDLLMYIDHCREEGDSTKLINRKLAAIRKYYEYLQQTDKTLKNPASGIILKGKKKGIPKHLLDMEELTTLYENYPVCDLRTARNKVILALVINQALTTDELGRLEPEHIKLKSGTITVPGSRRSGSRTLALAPNQVIELHEYLTETRPAILKAIKEKPVWPGRKAENPDFKRLNNQLLISMNGGSSLKNSLKHLTEGLKRINPKVKNMQQIRQSVLAEWLKTEDVRKVQYKAGHRSVSATERYQATNLEDLQEALNEHHPLK